MIAKCMAMKMRLSDIVIHFGMKVISFIAALSGKGSHANHRQNRSETARAMWSASERTTKSRCSAAHLVIAPFSKVYKMSESTS